MTRVKERARAKARQVATLTPERLHVLRAVIDAPSGPTGGVRFAHVQVALRRMAASALATASTAKIPVDLRVVDQHLQALRRAGYLKNLGRRDPKTGSPRRRWGWVLTPAGSRAA